MAKVEHLLLLANGGGEYWMACPECGHGVLTNYDADTVYWSCDHCEWESRNTKEMK